MNLDRILTSVPINRSSAKVAAGTHADLPLTPNQLRENLIPLLRRVDAALAAKPTIDVRERLIQQKLEIQARLTELRGHSKSNGPRGIASYFMDVAKEMLTKAQFDLILREAYSRAKDCPRHE